MDTEQFIQTLTAHKRILYKVISLYCKDEDDRKDLEQEIVIQLWKSWPSYNSQYKLSTWIYRIAMNVSISFFRSNHKRKSSSSPIHELIFKEEETADVLEDKRRFLNDFIKQLDDFNKEIMILYLEDYSYKEIAELVGITESNVGTKINRLKKRMQELISNNQYHGL